MDSPFLFYWLVADLTDEVLLVERSGGASVAAAGGAAVYILSRPRNYISTS